MYEKQILKLNDKIETQAKKTTRYAHQFIGQDMYPQVCSAMGWYKMFVDGQEYVSVNDLWFTTQLFVYTLQYNTKHIKNKKKFILDLLDHIYVQSATLLLKYNTDSSERTLRHILTVDGLTRYLETQTDGLYNLNIERILLPCEEWSMEFEIEETEVDVDYMLQIEYRKVL